MSLNLFEKSDCKNERIKPKKQPYYDINQK